MSMNNTRLGDAIVDRILTFAGIPPGAADNTRYRQMWRAIADEIIKEIQVYATITMADSEFQVLPGSFEENLPVANTPITGLGENKAFSLTGKIS